MLIFRVFATYFEVGDFHASFEGHFVKKIQHLFSFHAACCQYYSSCFWAVIWCWNFVLQCKSSEQPLCSFVLEIWNNNGKVDQSFFERFEQNGLIINRFSADCGLCPVIMLTQMCSRLILDNAFNLWVWYCVLPRVALWGKGMKVGRSGCFSLNLSDNSVMRERVRARRT